MAGLNLAGLPDEEQEQTLQMPQSTVEPLGSTLPEADIKLNLDNLPDKQPGNDFMLNDGMKTAPSKHRRDLTVSETTGVPVDVVGRDTDGDLELETKRSEIKEKTKGSPRTSDIMFDAILGPPTQDDIPTMLQIEDATRGTIVGPNTRGVMRGITRVEAGEAQSDAEQQLEQSNDGALSFAEIIADESGGSLIPDPFDLAFAAERYLTSREGSDEARASAQASLERVGQLNKKISEMEFSETAVEFQDDVRGADGMLEMVELAIENPIGALAFGNEVMSEFLPQLIAGTAVSVGTKSPLGGAITLGALSGLTERFASPAEFFQDRGFDLTKPEDVTKILNDPNMMNEAASYGLSRGVIIGSLDLLAGGMASKTFGGVVTTMLTQMGIQAGLGGGGEALAQFSTKGEIDTAEVFLEAIGEFATAPIEVAGVGHQLGMGKLRKVRAEKKAAERATAYKERLAQVLDAAGQSPVAADNPQLFQEVLDRLAEDSDLETINVNAAGLEASIDASGDVGGSVKFLVEAGIDEVEAERAARLGLDVEIKLPAFLSAMRDADVKELVIANVRQDALSPTLAEAEVAQADFEERVAAAAEEVNQDLNDVADEEAKVAGREAIAVSRDFVEKAKSAGQITDNANNVGLITVQSLFEREVAARAKPGGGVQFTEGEIVSFFSGFNIDISSKPFSGADAITSEILNQQLNTALAVVDSGEALTDENLKSFTQSLDVISGLLDDADQADPFVLRNLEEIGRIQVLMEQGVDDAELAPQLARLLRTLNGSDPAADTVDFEAALNTMSLADFIGLNPPAEITARHPELQAQLEVMMSIPETMLQEGFMTDEWKANRQYVAEDGSIIQGFDAAVDYLFELSASYAKGEVFAEGEVHIVIGPPAAGKSSALAEPIAEAIGARILDPDDAKKIIPEYGDGVGSNAVHIESKLLADAAADRATAETVDNLVLPLVGSKPSKIQATAANFKAKGRAVYLHYMALPVDETFNRMVRRFLDTNRMVPPEYLLQVAGGAAITYETIKDEEIFNGYIGYDNNVPFGERPIVFEEVSTGGRVVGFTQRLLRGHLGEAIQESDAVQATDPLEVSGAWRGNLIETFNEDGPAGTLPAGEVYDDIKKRQAAADALLECVNASIR